jgi:hypothetical protein
METLWAAVITGAVAIAAGFLGARWGGKNEHRQWVRNEKLRVYSDFIENSGAGDVALIRNGEFFDPAAIERRLHATHQLFLIAPPRVHDLAMAGLNDAMKAANALKDGVPKEEFERLMTARKKQVTLSSYVMRNDLHPFGGLRKRLHGVFLRKIEKDFEFERAQAYRASREQNVH